MPELTIISKNAEEKSTLFIVKFYKSSKKQKISELEDIIVPNISADSYVKNSVDDFENNNGKIYYFVILLFGLILVFLLLRKEKLI